MATIFVDQDLCTRCGICSTVCRASIIDPPDENNLPMVQDINTDKCIRCGHCKVFCPTYALQNIRAGKEMPLPADAGFIPPGDLEIYLKKRRSVRNFTNDPVPKEKIEQVLDIARYAASIRNSQPVQWLIVRDPNMVHRLAELTIDWMMTLKNSGHPLSGYASSSIAAWEAGQDSICNGSPHLVIAHIPEDAPYAIVNAIISLTHFDIAAPAFGIGTCWAGILSAAVDEYEPLQKALKLPAGRKYAYSILFGYHQYKSYGIPSRNPVQVTYY